MLGKWSGGWGSCQKSEERDVCRDAGLTWPRVCLPLLYPFGWFVFPVPVWFLLIFLGFVALPGNVRAYSWQGWSGQGWDQVWC